MQYKKGDLLKASESIIAHGCNCQGVMGAGVAKQIKNKYPKAYKKYKEYTPDNGLIGKIQPVLISNETLKIVINCFSQVYYGGRHKEFNYSKFKVIVKKIARYIYSFGGGGGDNYNVAIPRIGAGRGKGDWDIIESILKEYESGGSSDGGFEFIVYTL